MKKIQLTSYDMTGPQKWVPGQVVEVTPENESRAKRAVANRGAIVLGDVAPVEEADDDDDDESPSLDLVLTDPVDRLGEFGLNARYTAALKAAEIATIAQVVELGSDLANVSGISPKAAEQILQAINDEIED